MNLHRLQSHRLFIEGIKLFKFLAAGLPSFGVAIPLNWFLVSCLHWDEALAYALVLLLQVTVNFFMCRLFVFTNKKNTSTWLQFTQFLAGILAFRIADWTAYTIAVKCFGVHYLVMQLIDVFVFSILKFKFSKKVMEKT